MFILISRLIAMLLMRGRGNNSSNGRVCCRMATVYILMCFIVKKPKKEQIVDITPNLPRIAQNSLKYYPKVV